MPLRDGRAQCAEPRDRTHTHTHTRTPSPSAIIIRLRETSWARCSTRTPSNDARRCCTLTSFESAMMDAHRATGRLIFVVHSLGGDPNIGRIEESFQQRPTYQINRATLGLLPASTATVCDRLRITCFILIRHTSI